MFMQFMWVQLQDASDSEAGYCMQQLAPPSSREETKHRSFTKGHPSKHATSHPVIVIFTTAGEPGLFKTLSTFTLYQSILPARSAPHKREDRHERGHKLRIQSESLQDRLAHPIHAVQRILTRPRESTTRASLLKSWCRNLNIGTHDHVSQIGSRCVFETPLMITHLDFWRMNYA